ncbi:hypothetical protein IFM89_016255 [Coptis chinensis]|uniref:Uncharacterized protein n=1 Tax=Coptis chinensis TaxID=261450 RepID=A0A835H6E3_9MAGN|nr:hypothetical protein IFM89_016255 [Coptis chinensis]
MYNPVDNGEVVLTEEEEAERIKGLTKEIHRTNTRFHGKLVDFRPNEEDTIAVMYTPVAGGTPMFSLYAEREAEKTRKYDLEDMRKTPNLFYVESGKKADNGYNYEDTPVGIGGSRGLQFSIAYPSPRDVKAHTLSREAARKTRERSKMFKKPPLPSPGSWRLPGGASPIAGTPKAVGA